MERVAVLHQDPVVRRTLTTLIEGRGLAVVVVDSVEELAAQAERAPVALLMVDAASLRAAGLDVLQAAAHCDRPYAHVPIVLLARRDDPARETAGGEAIDELLWEPIDARELALRVDSGLARRRSTELLAVASHEFRSPVHAIVAFLDVLGRSELQAVQREMVDGARTASRHLVDLIEDLLEHARLGQGPVELEAVAFSLRDVVRDASSIALDAAAPGHVSIAASFADDLPEVVRGDGPRVRQIVINLLSNALKFAAEQPVRLHVRRADAKIEIEVRDDGPGVPETARALVFEPFRQADASVTRRFGGTGLGLAIARSLARRMGGDVRVESAHASDGAATEGAVFVVSLQLALDAPAMPGSQRASAPDVRRVALLADADAIHRGAVTPLLEHLGYRVEVVTEGVAALLHALEHRPELVVIDDELAVLGGTDVARRLRAADATMPIIGFVAGASDEQRASGVEAGMNAVLAKPIVALQLQRVLRRASTQLEAGARPAREAASDADEPSGERARVQVSDEIRDALRSIVAAVERHASTLEAAIASQNLGLAAEVTRTLRGAVLALNARGLEAVLRDIEQAARAGDREETRRAHDAWRIAIATLRQDVDRFLVRAAIAR